MRNKVFQILILVTTLLVAMSLLLIKGPKHDIFGLKLFADRQELSLAFKEIGSPSTTVYVYENDRYIKGEITESGNRVLLENLEYPYDKQNSYKVVLSIRYIYLGIGLMLGVLWRFLKRAKIK